MTSRWVLALALFTFACTSGDGDSADTGDSDTQTDPCLEVPLEPPMGLTAGSGRVGEIELDWRRREGAAGYIVERSDTEDGEFAEIGRTINTAFTDTGLADGVVRYYRVIAANQDGESCPSAVSRGETAEP